MIHDDDIDRALRALPRAAASQSFEAGVRRRLSDAITRRRRRMRAGAILGLVVAAASLTVGWHRARTESRAAELAALQAEERAIRSELQGLQDLAAARERVILDDDAERVLYIDWRTVRAAGKTPTEI